MAIAAAEPAPEPHHLTRTARPRDPLRLIIADHDPHDDVVSDPRTLSPWVGYGGLLACGAVSLATAEDR